ncbi:DNA-binding transcriptional regulator, FadR family [Paenibacillus catalpae]|uniref:DNA-binding transcriptional regulator, FadR family n=1 Tax=Paenibacillus catalpae TaxID=1045775 RepID=A0A1I1VMV1_9BACL|nr:FadR/GntR family transcriptional regulator [Paenibacillus catalpae]SFD81900.1 DNA-binding transcriptional regulator, FadR family [Paenibacillus catalpae]
MLKQTKRLTLVEQVAEQIESLIASGAWAVGTRIPPEPELMEQLQVSRNTLREAIRALTHAGLLKTRQGDGTYVCSSSALGPILKKRILRSNWLETLAVRHALEREAAHLAAERRDKEDLERMAHCLKQSKQAIQTEDAHAYARWDLEFHQTIVSSSRNGLLIELYDYISDSLPPILVEMFNQVDFLSFYHNHALLLEAITDQNSTKAAALVQQYIHETQEHFQNEDITGGLNPHGTDQ